MLMARPIGQNENPRADQIEASLIRGECICVKQWFTAIGRYFETAVVNGKRWSMAPTNDARKFCNNPTGQLLAHSVQAGFGISCACV